MKTKTSRNTTVIATLLLVVLGVLTPSNVSAQEPRSSGEAPGFPLPAGIAGQVYEYQFQAEGGVHPFIWRLVSGDLPPGISLTESGKLKGTPTAAQRDGYRLLIEVSDSSKTPAKVVQAFSLSIEAAPLRILTNTTQKLTVLAPTESPSTSPYAPELKVLSQRATKEKGSSSTHSATTNAVASVGPGAASAAGNFAVVSGQVKLAPEKHERWSAQFREKQKDFKTEHLKGLIVQAQDTDSDALLDSQLTDEDGNYELSVPFEAGTTRKITVSTEADDYSTRRTLQIRGDRRGLDIVIEDRPVSLLQRAVVGFAQSGASSAQSNQNYFFDLFVSKSLPFRQKIDPDFGERWKIWSDIRIASAPQQITAGVGTFAASFVQNVANLPVNKLGRAMEFLSGIEVRVSENRALLPSFARDTKQKFSLSFVAAFGATTPTDPKETIEVFKVTPGAPGLPPEAAEKDFIAFVTSDRDRFFRQYYAGLRINTYFFSKHDIPLQRFPAMFDIMYGQNEFVTGGRFRGGVFRLDGYFPLPFDGMKFINLFGTAYLKPGRTTIATPLILQAPDPATPVPVPAANVLLISSPHPNRDYYRVGVGIDFIQFIKTLKSLNTSP